MFITAPALNIRSIAWRLDQPAAVNVSPFTGKRSVMVNPWHARWSARVELAPIVGEPHARSVRSFLARCRGSLNTFRLHATEGPQNGNSGVTLAADAVAGDRSVTIAGAATPLLDGQFVTIAGQLLQLVADQAGAVLSFEPMLRAAAAAGTTVVTARPYALVTMTATANGWGVDPGQVYAVSFDVEEAILEADGSAPESGASEEPGSTAGEPIGLLLTLTKAA